MESRAGEGLPGTCAAGTRGSGESGGGGGERAAPPGLRPRGGAGLPAGREGPGAGMIARLFFHSLETEA